MSDTCRLFLPLDTPGLPACYPLIPFQLLPPGEIPWWRAWQPAPVFLPGESHGQSLGDYSPWGRKESDMTDATEHPQPYNPAISLQSTHARKLETSDQIRSVAHMIRPKLVHKYAEKPCS